MSLRLVVKIGTQALLTRQGTVNRAMITKLVDQIARLKKQGHEVVLVSSGAVGTGRGMLAKQNKKLKFPDPVLEKQALSSIGQAELIHTYNEILKKSGLVASQLLMTKYDFRLRRHYINIARLLENLLQQKNILPVLNENDALAVEELMFTDNDTLAGLVAGALNADRLIVLTAVNGVYDPETNRQIREIKYGGVWPKVTAGAGAGGRGGMANKLETARKMAQAGIMTHIARARTQDVLLRILKDEKVGTRVVPSSKRSSSMKRWLVLHPVNPRGQIVINTRLVEKLSAANDAVSILPVGVVSVPMSFKKGDIVEILDEKQNRVGLGQARYGAKTLKKYLGQSRKPAFVHYNALHLEEE